MSVRRSRPVVAALLIGALVPSAAFGDASTPAPSPSASASTSPALQEAQEHYRRALELFDEGNYEAAEIEFRRAYELAPTYRLLYNLGQVANALKDYARALDYFERYLAEGGAQVPAARKGEVSDAIVKLKSRIGTLRFDKMEAGLSIQVDDVVVGVTPLPAGVRVNVGKRRVTATAKGRPPASVIIEVGGAETKQVELGLARDKAPIVVTDRSWIPIVGFTSTALLAGGAVFAGVVAYNAAKRNEDLRGTAGADLGEIQSTDSRRKTFATVTDILAVSSVVVGGLTLYFTLADSKKSTTKVNVGSRPGGAELGLTVQF